MTAYESSADIEGFTLHTAVRVQAQDRKRLEQLCRYITRPALSDDAGKKVKGRKRHLVDTLGLVSAVTVTAASVQDHAAADAVVAAACAKVPGLSKLYADSACAGRCKQRLERLHAISADIVRRPHNRVSGTHVVEPQQQLFPDAPAPGFVILAKRWVVERRHAWNERARRLLAHHDRSNWAPVAWVWLVEGRILATRLATQNS